MMYEERPMSAAILAGGRSRRMGTDKSGLYLQGETFAERLVREFSSFPDLWISCGREHPYCVNGVRCVTDCCDDCGPIGGIATVLRVCKEEYLFVTACDTPFVDRELAELMMREALKEKKAGTEPDIIMTVDADNRLRPIPGIYSRNCLPVMENQIREGKRRLRDLVHLLRTEIVSAGRIPKYEHRMKNVNTAQEYREMIIGEYCRERGMRAAAFCGWSGSGKTAFLEKLTGILTQRGLRVAYIKHEGHTRMPDCPGKDTFRMAEAGACMTTVISEGGAVYAEYGNIDSDMLSEECAARIKDTDIILIEGFTRSSWPKVLVDGGNEENEGPKLLPGEYIAVVSKQGTSGEWGVPVFRHSEAEKAADYLFGETFRRSVPCF